jgi:tetratricopeptide (TPR) repeat protein
MGVLEKALEDFNKAIEIDGQNSIIYANRGLVNRKMENYEKAIEDYGQEIKYGPHNNIKAYNNRAYC